MNKKFKDLSLADRIEPQISGGSSCPTSSFRNKSQSVDDEGDEEREGDDDDDEEESVDDEDDEEEDDDSSAIDSDQVEEVSMEERVLNVRRVAEDAYSKYAIVRNALCEPIIIAMKGDQLTGRKMIAFYVASILRCPLIKKQDFDNDEEKSEEYQTNIWKKICSLARSQLTSGRSVIIDTELANQKDFDQLKELSEVTRTRLAIFECQLEFAKAVWDSRIFYKLEGDPVIFIIYKYLKKPTTQYINSTNFNMGEIPIILVEYDDSMQFSWSMNCALIDLWPYFFPTLESKEHEHTFRFANIKDEYKTLCRQCRQPVSGSVYRCHICRILIHPTCSYFPEKLSVVNYSTLDKVTLDLRHVVPELDADANCNCCKQFIRSSTSTRYYSTADGHNFFDMECLFSLPAKLSTKLHTHELIQSISDRPSVCNECDTIIDKHTIRYVCLECSISYDMFCLWLPQRAHSNRDTHPLKLLILPRVDLDPYYCHGCETERDTDKWIYYCEECDFQNHPRCIVKAPYLPRYSSTEISTTNTNSKEKLTDMEFYSYRSHLPTERLMVRDLPSRHRSEAEELCLFFKESTKDIKIPIIITTKGHSTERKLVASTLAATFSCLLIDEDSLPEVSDTANENIEVYYQVLCQIALSQIEIGLSVVIECDLSHESEFLNLQDFALDTGTPLFIVEFKSCEEDKVQGLHRIVDLPSDYEYDIGITPKIVVDVTAPTLDDINKIIRHILHSISDYSKKWGEGSTRDTLIQSCYVHFVHFQKDDDVLEGDICKRCSMKVSYPILKCKKCGLVLHKECTALPLRIRLGRLHFKLEKLDDDNKAKCDCCRELVKGYAYMIQQSLCIDLNCLFTPSKPGINPHEHPLHLKFRYKKTFKCGACATTRIHALSYRCSVKGCEFKIGVQCGWLKEKEPFDRHCHPFDLIVSPEHVSNQYYCEVCQEERDKNHWVYCCVPCDYFIHVRCIVPTGGCPQDDVTDDDNDDVSDDYESTDDDNDDNDDVSDDYESTDDENDGGNDGESDK